MSTRSDIPLRDRPIAVFDSGVGGLTVVQALRQRLPSEHILYVGDTARVPYGSKSAAAVTRYATEITRWLMRDPVKMLIVACNTVSSVAMGTLTDVLDPTGAVPLMGVIGPGAHAALAETGPGGRVAVVGTEGTIQRGSYQRVLKALDPQVEVFARACPLLVPLAEEGWHEDPVTDAVVERYFAPIRDWGPQALVLGCTHYPILREAIARVMGPQVTIVDSAEPTAREVHALLAARDLHRQGEGQTRFFVTDGPDRFAAVGERFLRAPLGEVGILPLDALIQVSH